VARFGWRLYRTFFKTYTEKVWGVPVSEMPADWAAQRVKNLDLVRAGGGTVVMDTAVRTIHVGGGRATGVTVVHAGGGEERLAARHVISSTPMNGLVKMIDPPAPPEVLKAADDLHYRDFLTVALVVPEDKGFPDNWIYIHAKEVAVGRIQNFGSWSPFMVKEGRTCLGLEYFVFEGDELWNSTDEELVDRARRELGVLGLVDPADVEAGYVVRVPKAYPHYDYEYQANVSTITAYLASTAPNVYPVGRNGMHKYNNQDHSMYTAMLTVENILGAHHDIWAVNVEEEYHEQRVGEEGAGGRGGTGRDAPVLPRRAPAG